jgi:CRISPR-associated protein Cmr2
MKSNSLYTALTIGPIYETFVQTKKTSAVWAASYFFSWFMKELTRRTHDAGFKILMPALNGEDVVFKSKFGSGLYADRIYFEPSSKEKKELEDVVNTLISDVAKEINENQQSEVMDYLQQYLNIHIVELEINDKSKVLKTLNDQLDLKELAKNYPFKNETNYLLQFCEQKINESFLAEDAFGKIKNEKKFLSIPEIATTTLFRTDNEGKYIKARNKEFRNEDIELIDALKEQVFDILPYHKYYAVLYADGDYIGKNILMHEKVAPDFDKLRGFSQQIFRFGQQAEEKITQYGGNGIYLGGEDILAFLPVACINESKTETHTIFNLIQELDICFESTVGAFAKENSLTPPTLSYGIMISYIKHPLREAMQIAHDLMEYKAKKKPGKNAVALRFQKHSGQFMECCIEKSESCSWNYIKELVKEFTIKISDDKKEGRKANADLLSGVIHRLKDDMYFEVFDCTAREGRLEPFFQNFFDEKVHKGDDNPKNIFLKKIRELSVKVFDKYPDNQQCREIIFTVLRFIHFINSEKE